tara:strand:+ start:225 stop:365 length:141 start_codon:yes stop_codon:yes gene_type:complete
MNESEKREAIGRLAQRIRNHSDKPVSYRDSLDRAVETARRSDRRSK